MGETAVINDELMLMLVLVIVQRAAAYAQGYGVPGRDSSEDRGRSGLRDYGQRASCSKNIEHPTPNAKYRDEKPRGERQNCEVRRMGPLTSGYGIAKRKAE